MTDTSETRYDIDSFPSHLECIVQILFFMVIEDTGFYWTHRLLH